MYLINSWYSIAIDQLRILLTSGLYDACEEINIGCIGFQEQRDFLQKYICDPYPKFKIRVHSENPLDYEYPTLRLIEADKSEYIGFYFHTKAVTRPFESNISHWRHYLNEMVLNRWQEHRARVESGEYGASSCNFLRSPDHFSGNFWWFNRDYINCLPPLSALDPKNRYHCEQWICMNGDKLYSIPFIEPGNAIIQIKYNKLCTQEKQS